MTGTRLFMTLQRADHEYGTLEEWIAADVLIIRHGNDGFGGAFVPSRPRHADQASYGVGKHGEILTLERFTQENCGDKETLARFVQQLTVSEATCEPDGERQAFTQDTSWASLSSETEDTS